MGVLMRDIVENDFYLAEFPEALVQLYMETPQSFICRRQYTYRWSKRQLDALDGLLDQYVHLITNRAIDTEDLSDRILACS